MQHNKQSFLPIRIDPQLLANQGKQLEGLISVKQMARLQESVLSMQPNVVANLQFSQGEYGFPLLTGKIQHKLNLRCERCLDEISIELDLAVKLTLKPNDIPQPKSDNLPEFYEYDGQTLMLAEIIEDELLLALPLVPKHKDISLCDQDMVAWLASNEVPAQKRDNPFAILKR